MNTQLLQETYLSKCARSYEDTWNKTKQNKIKIKGKKGTKKKKSTYTQGPLLTEGKMGRAASPTDRLYEAAMP